MGTDVLKDHGGNINAARALYPAAPEPWIDLSTGINGVPYAVGEISSDAWNRLPEPADLAELEAAARAAYAAPPAAEIVAAPGTQAIIQILPRLARAARVGIVGPTYSEHAKSWRSHGATVIDVAAWTELEDCDVGVIVNPNNPDGRLIAPDILAKLAAAFAARGGLLVVDEAFMDVIDPPQSLIPVLPAAGVAVLRSFGKTYGLAGLRLGFLVGSSGLVAALRAAMGPWAVSGPAIGIGRRALADRPWLAGTTRRLADDSRRLDDLLRSAGFTLLGGTPLFRLVGSDLAERWFETLCRHGILVRPFGARKNLLRFGIPGDQPAWARLAAALNGAAN